MDFAFAREHEMLRKAVREFVEIKVDSKVLELDEKGVFPHELIKEMGQMGFIGLINSQEYGGTGMGNVARMIVVEELACVYPSLGFFYQAGNLFMYAIENFGTEEQKKRFLPGLCSGTEVSAFAVTEQSGGSDPSTMMTVGVLDGNEYIINGRKTYITNSEVADVVGFIAKTGDNFSVFCVEKGTPGFEVTRREPRPGLRCIPVNELAFTNCRIPKANLIGEKGRGMAAAITTISVIGRTGAAAVALGAAQGAYNRAMKFCRERILYGKPITNLQAIQFEFVKMKADIEAARWLCYKPVVLLDQGKTPREVSMDIALAKLVSVDMAINVTLQAQRVMGAYGQSPEYRVEMYLRDILELLTAGGTQEIMKVTIGKSITA